MIIEKAPMIMAAGKQLIAGSIGCLHLMIIEVVRSSGWQQGYITGRMVPRRIMAAKRSPGGWWQGRPGREVPGREIEAGRGQADPRGSWQAGPSREPCGYTKCHTPDLSL